ncbi:MAG TPA: hypothetical protein VFY90_07765, partial [Tepidiformaceae bacterium]|nr:hypothetical protein [Tepidiformaceae bacterium]
MTALRWKGRAAPRVMALFWLLLLACALTSAASAEQAASSGPPDSVMALAGVFRAGRAHDLAIAPFRTPAGWILLMADRQTDQLRFLAPVGKRVWAAGPEITRPSPVQWTLTF